LGENVLRALKREVEEETNLIVSDAKMFGMHSTILNGANGIFRVFRTVFRCRTMGKIKLSKEHEGHKWISRKEIDTLNFVEGFNFNDIISVKKNM